MSHGIEAKETTLRTNERSIFTPDDDKQRKNDSIKHAKS